MTATGASVCLHVPSLLKREFPETKWADARRWTKAQLVRSKNSKYRPSDKQKPDPRANKRLASRFYQLNQSRTGREQSVVAASE